MTTTPASRLTRSVSRRALLTQAAVTGVAVPVAGLLRGRRPHIARAADPLKVGAIIPFTGIETHNGLAMRYGLEIGADEINAAGGLAGRLVELYQEDDGGDVERGVAAAQKLIHETKIDVLIGTLTSSVRTAVFEETVETRTLFLNPSFYEGGLCDRYYFSSGAVPNQTVEPLAAFALQHLGKSFYFVVSDYVWGAGSVAVAKPAVEAGGGTVAGEEYAPLGTTDFANIINRINEAAPDVVWPFVAGQDGITFLNQLSDLGVRASVKVCADYIDELVVPALASEVAAGIVTSSTYYMALPNPANQAFIQTMRAKYGAGALISSFGMNMYNNMKLIQAAATATETWNTDDIVTALETATFDGPSGKLTTDATNHHVTQDVSIATIQPDKSFKLEQTLPQVAPKAGCTVTA